MLAPPWSEGCLQRNIRNKMTDTWRKAKKLGTCISHTSRISLFSLSNTASRLSLKNVQTYVTRQEKKPWGRVVSRDDQKEVRNQSKWLLITRLWERKLSVSWPRKLLCQAVGQVISFLTRDVELVARAKPFWRLLLILHSATGAVACDLGKNKENSQFPP